MKWNPGDILEPSQEFINSWDQDLKINSKQDWEQVRLQFISHDLVDVTFKAIVVNSGNNLRLTDTNYEYTFMTKYWQLSGPPKTKEDCM